MRVGDRRRQRHNGGCNGRRNCDASDNAFSMGRIIEKEPAFCLNSGLARRTLLRHINYSFEVRESHAIDVVVCHFVHRL